MVSRWIVLPLVVVPGAAVVLLGCAAPAPASTLEPDTPCVPASAATIGPSDADVMPICLPRPRYVGPVSLEETLLTRRSIRKYSSAALTLEEAAQLLWAAQGQTAEGGGRTAPSAGALYPLELYLVVGNVSDLAPGVYRYRPRKHDLVRTGDKDPREALARAALDQAYVREAATDIIIAADYNRTTVKYGDRGVRYVHMEAGHAAQNLYLQATALDLAMVVVGGFYDQRVKDILALPKDQQPLYIVPVGRKRQTGPAQ